MTHPNCTAAPDMALRWTRSETLHIRPPVGEEWALATDGPFALSQLQEGPLAPAAKRRVITVDHEIGAAFSMARGHWIGRFFGGGVVVQAEEVLSALEVHHSGSWAVKAGLWVDLRQRHRRSDSSWRRLLHLAGPVAATVFAARHGLKGYVAAVILHGWPRYSPALSPTAYLQQVAAGSIDAPLLRAHLHHGARHLAVIDNAALPMALLQWRRS